MDRPEKLDGCTYKIKMNGATEITLYLTVNHIEKESFSHKILYRPFEVFINTKNAEIIEHVMAATILISKGLQRNETLQEIGTSWLDIASPFTSHMKRGGMSKSMYSRIGEVLIAHDKLLTQFNRRQINHL